MTQTMSQGKKRIEDTNSRIISRFFSLTVFFFRIIVHFRFLRELNPPTFRWRLYYSPMKKKLSSKRKCALCSLQLRFWLQSIITAVFTYHGCEKLWPPDILFVFKIPSEVELKILINETIFNKISQFSHSHSAYQFN